MRLRLSMGGPFRIEVSLRNVRYWHLADMRESSDGANATLAFPGLACRIAESKLAARNVAV